MTLPSRVLPAVVLLGAALAVPTAAPALAGGHGHRHAHAHHRRTHHVHRNARPLPGHHAAVPAAHAPPPVAPVVAAPAALPSSGAVAPAPAPVPAVQAVMVTAMDHGNGEFMFTLSRDTVDAGPVRFSFVDADASDHDLVLRRPDGTTLLIAALSGGSNAYTSAVVTLTPGTYTLLCDLPGHEAAGMHATLTVVAG